ncbi:MAG: hypothetical protein AAF891_04145 [Pseudomonadota bacterium]
MSFVRPEAQAALWRWRETLVGIGLMGFALLWAANSFGPLRIMALVGAALAIMLMFVGFQRARFRSAAGGQGVVQVDEQQITYFGPLSGGTLALADIGALSLNRQSTPYYWQLVPLQGTPLLVPVDAAGGDALFDVFSNLPGLKTEKMLHALNHGADGQIVIWRRADVQARAAQLH